MKWVGSTWFCLATLRKVECPEDQLTGSKLLQSTATKELPWVSEYADNFRELTVRVLVVNSQVSHLNSSSDSLLYDCVQTFSYSELQLFRLQNGDNFCLTWVL